jgi:hypothetical protein
MLHSAECRGCKAGGLGMRDGRTRERRVPQDGSEKKRYFFSDLRFLRLQNIYIGTTSGQLKIANPRGGVKTITKTAN